MSTRPRPGLIGLLAYAVLTLNLAAAELVKPRVAELEQKLAAATPADKSLLLVQLSEAVENDDTRRSWDLAQQARREARSPVDEIRADARQAAVLRRRGDYNAALATAQAALARPEARDNPALRSELLLVIANTQDSQSDFSAALETFRLLLPLAETRADARFLARVYNVLGITYYDAGQPALSRSAYESARGFAEKAGDQRMVASVLNNLGNIATDARDFARARASHEQSLALRESIGGDARGIADSQQNLAELDVLEGRPADAPSRLDRALSAYAALGLKRNQVNAHVTYASALRGLGRLDEALVHLRAAQSLAESLASPTVTARVFREFAACHEAAGDFRAALADERKAAAATDAAIGEKSRQRFDSLQARFDAERRLHEIDVLRRDQAENEGNLVRVRWQRYGLLALLALGAVALGAIISRHRLKLRAEQRILAETRAGRDAAEQAAALKTRLLAMVSHDIRGPLGNILYLAEDLRTHADPGPVTVEDRLQLIAQETERVLLLAQDLLDAASLEAGRLDLKIAPLDLAEIVSATIERLRPAAAAKEQVITFSAAEAGAGKLPGDAARLGQVFANLLSNAVKYSPARTRVHVSLDRRDGLVRLAVRDEGPGIPPDDLPNLFRPFARLRARPTAGESTNGLGLSIVHELVLLHGGHILVDSAPGLGTTFIVELPAGGPPKK